MSDHPGDYDTLIKPIENQMIRSIWRLVRDPDDADDAFQQALETIWKHLDRVRRHPNPHALILRICINSAYGVLRWAARHRRREELDALPEERPDPAPSAREQLVQQQEQGEVMQAIGRLPRKQGEAVLMRCVQELPYGDIAQALGCREVTARKHVARAREKLCRLLAHLLPTSIKEVATYEPQR